MSDSYQFFPYRLDRRWAPTFVTLRVKKTDGVTITADGTAAGICAQVEWRAPIAPRAAAAILRVAPKGSPPA